MFQIALKKFREQYGLSQTALAKDLGVKQSTVGMWESGSNGPKYNMLIKIAEYFYVTVSDLVGDKAENNTFGIILKELRERKKISQSELAKKIGVSQSAIGIWESGTGDPSADMMVIISNYFGVSVDYLLGKEKAPEKQGLSDDEQRLISFFRAASSDGKNSILRVARNECQYSDEEKLYAQSAEILLHQNQDFQEKDA